MSILTFQKIIKRADLVNNRDTIYVFGDNLVGRGYGGQAAEMRGEPNALGIPTKRSPSEYLSDTDFWDMDPIYRACFKKLYQAVNQGKKIVWPYDGIGTGLAQLETKSPQCWTLLQLYINDFMADIRHLEKEQENV